MLQSPRGRLTNIIASAQDAITRMCSAPRVRAVIAGSPSLMAVSRTMIALYFVHESWSMSQQFLSMGRTEFDVLFDICLLPVALILAAGFHVPACATILGLATVWDSMNLLYGVYQRWARGYGLYVNELMVKKLSLIGCVSLLLASNIKRDKNSVAGMLLESVQKESRKYSLLMLIGRLLIGCLFLYVGVGELTQLCFPHHHRHHHGDGHDKMWPKVVELLLSLPFALGFHTVWVSRGLASSLVIESLTAWQFWNIAMPTRDVHLKQDYIHLLLRSIHTREHFCVNVAVAGGLLLLQKHGGGKYTIDQWLKKHK